MFVEALIRLLSHREQNIRPNGEAAYGPPDGSLGTAATEAWPPAIHAIHAIHALAGSLRAPWLPVSPSQPLPSCLSAWM